MRLGRRRRRVDGAAASSTSRERRSAAGAGRPAGSSDPREPGRDDAQPRRGDRGCCGAAARVRDRLRHRLLRRRRRHGRRRGRAARVGLPRPVCVEWEAAAAGAPARHVAVRTAFVVGPGATALRLMALPYRLFLGGPLGGGRQWFPWIQLDDLVAVYRLAIGEDGPAGPVNAVAPQQLRQREVADAMGAVLHRPAVLPTPAALVRLARRRAGRPPAARPARGLEPPRRARLPLPGAPPRARPTRCDGAGRRTR